MSLGFGLVTGVMGEPPAPSPLPSPLGRFWGIPGCPTCAQDLVYLWAVTDLCWCPWALPRQPPPLGCRPGEERPRPRSRLSCAVVGVPQGWRRGAASSTAFGEAAMSSVTAARPLSSDSDAGFLCRD